jgi:hypothetical protein
VHSGQVANYQIFSNARSPRRELDRIFTNMQNSKSASLQHLCVANFGFDRTLEIMMLVWLYLRSPPMLMPCNNEDNFQTVTLEHFSARWNRANSTKRPLTKILRVFDRR